MNKISHKLPITKRPPFECIALLLQGGGALGAYQAGVYEALWEAGIEIDWVSGISVGAINSAIIAGNPHEKRVEKLREFWDTVSNNTAADWFGDSMRPFLQGDTSRTAANQMNAMHAMMFGVNGFYAARPVPPCFLEPGSPGSTSYYDTSKLKATLEKLVDFDLLNAQAMRLTVSAVNVRSGNYVLFDTQNQRITVDHVMASGALPPGFPPIEIEGEYYWDGGLVSNTPLESVLDTVPRMDTLAFQVDLWSAEGDMPRTLPEVMTRQKEIMFSSRTRAATNRFREQQIRRNAFLELYEKLPKELKEMEGVKYLSAMGGKKVYNIIHLIYHAQNYEGDSKDYEFSRLSMEEHWKAGYSATVRTLRHKEVLERPNKVDGVFTFDISRHLTE